MRRHPARLAVVSVATLAFAALAGIGVHPGVARAESVDFHIVDQQVTVDADSQTATFTLTFDREPRFSGPHGGGGGQPNAFQYEIDADTSSLDRPIEWSDVDTVIRGGEIAAGDGIPVRDRDGNGNGNSGGWGPVRALLPFDLDGETLTFTAGLSALGDTDGAFRYRVFTTDGGSLTGQVIGAVIPLPAALWTGLTLLGGLGAAGKLKKLRRA